MMPLQRLTKPFELTRTFFPDLRHELDRLFENFLGPENQLLGTSAVR